MLCKQIILSFCESLLRKYVYTAVTIHVQKRKVQAVKKNKAWSRGTSYVHVMLGKVEVKQLQMEDKVFVGAQSIQIRDFLKG